MNEINDNINYVDVMSVSDKTHHGADTMALSELILQVKKPCNMTWRARQAISTTMTYIEYV